MEDFFRAYQAVGTTIPTYFIESTAPDNVDDLGSALPPLRPELKPIDSELAIQQIAEVLASEPDPNLVVMVHGFNNPRDAVLKTYVAAARAIGGDAAIRDRRGLVCVGYRWPSESMGEPRHGTWTALPTLPTWILKIGGAVVVVLGLVLFSALIFNHWGFSPPKYFAATSVVHILTLIGFAIVGLVLAAALLRTIVYFRDNYRASNYGVPDLIQIITAIDGKVVELGGPSGATGAHDHRVQLSFIGHSMGGFVVTNTIRSLSDLFATPVRSLNSYGSRAAPDEGEPPSPNIRHIGNVFSLMRFVLASPDIPGETLMSNRGNFLRAALERFDEAYLFSNEGDAVLRQISTLANYFVFPTKSQYHGFRLGNVEILARNFGVIHISEDDFLSVLRIGKFTLQELYDELQSAAAARHVAAASPGPPPPPDVRLPKVFTYFDCTDYKDFDTQHVERPLLTFAKCLKRRDANARLRWYSHQHLLWAYLLRHQRPNVHGGYFEGELSQRLIYRLACLGYDDTVKAFGGEGAMSTACADKQIRAVISPKLFNRRTQAAPLVAPAAAPAPPRGPAAPTTSAPGIGVVVPNVVGMPIEQAREAIRAVRDLYIGAVALPVRGTKPQLLALEVAQESTRPAGTVLSQTPAPGTRVEQGTSIELVIAKA